MLKDFTHTRRCRAQLVDAYLVVTQIENRNDQHTTCLNPKGTKVEKMRSVELPSVAERRAMTLES